MYILQFVLLISQGLLFSPFSWVNSKGVLTFGTTFTLVLSGLLALLFNIDSLSQMISAGTLLAYAAVCSGIITMRYGPAPKKEKLEDGEADELTEYTDGMGSKKLG